MAYPPGLLLKRGERGAGGLSRTAWGLAPPQGLPERGPSQSLRLLRGLLPAGCPGPRPLATLVAWTSPEHSSAAPELGRSWTLEPLEPHPRKPESILDETTPACAGPDILVPQESWWEDI